MMEIKMRTLAIRTLLLTGTLFTLGSAQQQTPETCAILDDQITAKTDAVTVCTRNELCTSIQCNTSVDPATNLIDTEILTFDPCTDPLQVNYMYASGTMVIVNGNTNETVTLELRFGAETAYVTLVLNQNSTGIDLEVFTSLSLDNTQSRTSLFARNFIPLQCEAYTTYEITPTPTQQSTPDQGTGVPTPTQSTPTPTAMPTPNQGTETSTQSHTDTQGTGVPIPSNDTTSGSSASKLPAVTMIVTIFISIWDALSFQ